MKSEAIHAYRSEDVVVAVHLVSNLASRPLHTLSLPRRSKGPSTLGFYISLG